MENYIKCATSAVVIGFRSFDLNVIYLLCLRVHAGLFPGQCFNFNFFFYDSL